MLVNGKNYRTVWMEGSEVSMIDQTLLPHFFKILKCHHYQETANAIKTMIIRGAGALAIAGAYAVVQVFIQTDSIDEFDKGFQVVRSTRPTAQNLFYAIDRVKESGLKGKTKTEKIELAMKMANRLANEDSAMANQIGEYGESLIQNGMRILTHCNAGWLAFVDWGTAIAPIYKAYQKGKNVFVWVDETRPLFQGSRLTSWELGENLIPHKIIPDNAAAYYMANREVDIIITGADRIALNGDTANKIGTLDRAILASYYKIPFYIAAPITTIDFSIQSGNQIPIEQRNEEEVLYVQGLDDAQQITRVRVAPVNSKSANPAFDVTTSELITGFITNKGIYKPNELRSLQLD